MKLDGKITWHGQNLNEDKFNRKGFWLKHSRVWVTIFSLKMSSEFIFFSRFCQLKFGVDRYDGDEIKINIGTPLFTFWFHFTTPGIGKFIRKHVDGYEGRDLGVSIHDWSIVWSGWHTSDSWSTGTPWYRYFYFNIPDFFLGKSKYSMSVLETHDVMIPMSEGTYSAIVDIEESKWKRPRWFTKKRIGAEVKIRDKTGIPVPGKGTTSYNCDEDALFAMGCNAKTAEEAIGQTVEDVMATRRRYGGANWLPKAVRK